MATLARQTGSCRYFLGKPSIEQVTWQTRPNGHSIGTILLHLAEVESYWIETVCSGREISGEEKARYLSDAMDPFEGIWPTPPREPIEYFLAIQDEVRARTMETAKTFPSPSTVTESQWGRQTVPWVLSHLIWHESYHGGQAVLLSELSRLALDQKP